MRRAILLLSLLLLGCQTPVPAPSGFLGDYASLQRKPGAGIHFSDPRFDAAPTSPTHVVVIGKVEWRAGDALSLEAREELRGYLAERLRKRLLQGLSGATFVVRSEEEADGYQRRLGAAVMRIDAAITSVNEGNGWGRYLIGLGLGDAKMVVEARAVLSFYPPGAQHQVHVFARTNGNPCGGLNLRVFSSRYCFRMCCEQAARVLAEHVAERIRAPEPEWWKHVGGRAAAPGISN